MVRKIIILILRVYIHKNFVANSKNQNSYFELILKRHATALRILR